MQCGAGQGDEVRYAPAVGRPKAGNGHSRAWHPAKHSGPFAFQSYITGAIPDNTDWNLSGQGVDVPVYELGAAEMSAYTGAQAAGTVCTADIGHPARLDKVVAQTPDAQSQWVIKIKQQDISS